MKKCSLMFMIFQIIVTLNDSQGYEHCYQNVEFTGLYHQTKLDRNRSENVRIQTIVNVYLTKSDK